MNGLQRKIFRLILRLYPASFRESFPDVAEVFDDRLSEARSRGRLAVARLWWRELAELPSALASARGTEAPAPIVTGALVVATLLSICVIAGAQVTTTGLFHRGSQLVLVVALALAGYGLAIVSAGVRLRASLVILVLIAGFVTAPVMIDRVLLRVTGEGVTEANLPGVVIRVTRTARSGSLEGRIEERTAYRRSVLLTRSHGDSRSIAELRTGGVDGIYAVVCLGLALLGLAAARPRQFAAPAR